MPNTVALGFFRRTNILFKVLLMELAARTFVRILLTAIVAASTASTIGSVLFIDPRISTVIINDSVGFTCSAKNVSRQDWQFINDVTLNDSQYSADDLCVTGGSSFSCTELVSYGDIKKNYKGLYELVTGTGRNGNKESRISIPNAGMERAGVYRCHGGYGRATYSFLNVIDPNPHCNDSSYNSTTDGIYISCFFKFFGVTANLHWTNGVDKRRNNCTEQYNSIACAILITSVSEDSCNLSQCIDKDKHHMFVNGNNRFHCIWGVYQILDNQTDEFIYTFQLDTRIIAFVRCFNSTSISEKATQDFGNSATGIAATIIGLAVTSLIVLIVILKLTRFRRKDIPKGVIESAYSAAKEFPDEESHPVYGKVNKSKVDKSVPLYAEVKLNGRTKVERNAATNGARICGNTSHENVMSIQQRPKLGTGTSKTETDSSNLDSDGNNIVYAELGHVTPTFRMVENRSPAVRDGFDRSEYVMIDHDLKFCSRE